jgi:hypothetical protein
MHGLLGVELPLEEKQTSQIINLVMVAFTGCVGDLHQVSQVKLKAVNKFLKIASLTLSSVFYSSVILAIAFASTFLCPKLDCLAIIIL